MYLENTQAEGDKSTFFSLPWSLFFLPTSSSLWAEEEGTLKLKGRGVCCRGKVVDSGTGQIPGCGIFSAYFKLGDFLRVKIMIVMASYQDVWGPTEKVDELADSA